MPSGWCIPTRAVMPALHVVSYGLWLVGSCWSYLLNLKVIPVYRLWCGVVWMESLLALHNAGFGPLPSVSSSQCTINYQL